MKKTPEMWDEDSRFELSSEEIAVDDYSEEGDLADENDAGDGTDSVIFADGKYKAIFDHTDNSFDHNKTIDMYDRYKAGSISRDEWLIYLCTIIEFYLVKLVKKFSRNHGSISSFEDLQMTAYLAVMESVDEYDPHKSRPTVFFTPRLNGMLNKCFTDEVGNLSSYYNTVKQEVEKKLRKEGYSGIDDERLSFAQIAHLTGVPQVTLKEIIEQGNITKGSLDVYSENHADDKFLSPEESVEKQEEQEIVDRILGTLNPVENFILFHTEYADIPLSTKIRTKKTKKDKDGYYDFCPYEERVGNREMTLCQIAKYLKTKEAKERFAEYIPAKVTGLVVQQILQGALDKLSLNPAAKRYFNGGTKRNGSFIEEQCTENDLMQAFTENILSFG